MKVGLVRHTLRAEDEIGGFFEHSCKGHVGEKAVISISTEFVYCISVL